MQEKIVVVGGSGFIGSEICRLVSLMDHQVVSISRKGRPPIKEDWTDKVQWVAADVFKPESWSSHLEGSKAVIHCVAIILEGVERNASYQHINVESTKIVAREADHWGVQKVVYTSVSEQVSVVPGGFFQSKRQAEKALEGHPFKVAVLRPGLVYGPRRSPTVLMGRAILFMENVPGIGKELRKNRPLSVRQVASAAIQAALNDNIQGLLNVEAIEKLAQVKLRTLAANQNG